MLSSLDDPSSHTINIMWRGKRAIRFGTSGHAGLRGREQLWLGPQGADGHHKWALFR